MKKIPLLITSFFTIYSLSAKNSLYETMMKDRKKILDASQNTEISDSLNTTTSDPEQATSSSLSSLTNLKNDEITLTQELDAVVEDLKKLSKEKPSTDSNLKSEPT